MRKTDDVDVIIDVATHVEYYAFSQKLRELGFREDVDGPICVGFLTHLLEESSWMLCRLMKQY